MLKVKLKICVLLLCFAFGLCEILDCDYFDTVDLTGSELLSNGSYNYEGVVIPPEQTGTYNYKIFFEGTHTSVPEHIRGCVCKFKNCIRYCCHRHRLDLKDESKCARELGNTKINITQYDGTRIERDLLDQFVVQPGIRIDCNKPHHLVPYTYTDSWKLFDNGTLYRFDDAKYLSKSEYCIQPEEIAALGNNYKLLPMNCLNNHDVLYVNLASIIILVLTILVYIFVLKLEHIHDMCYLCYLICLSLSLLVNIITSVDTFLLGVSCYFMAYMGYFFSISIYLWLAVISYDLWQKLVVHMFEIVQENIKLRFRIYSLFVWGSASVLLLLTILADHLLADAKIDSSWKMGYLYYECFAKLTDWSAIVYFFGRVALMVACNTTLVCITSKHIYQENKKNREQLRQFGKQNVKKNIRFTIYLRFFVIAIMDWSIELTATVYNLAGNPPDILHFVMFYLGLVECIFIFAVTLTRRDVIQLLKRCSHQRQNRSLATTMTSLSLNPRKLSQESNNESAT